MKVFTTVIRRAYTEVLTTPGTSYNMFVDINTIKNTVEYHNIVTQYSNIYDRFKIVSMTKKMYCDLDNNTLTNSSVPRMWYMYDPDSGKELFDTTNLRKNVAAKWKLMRPYQVHTFRLKPDFAHIQLPNGVSSYTGKRKYNPWWDLGDYEAGNLSAVKSKNGINYIIAGPPPGSATQRSMIVEETIRIQFAGLRQTSLPT